MLNKKCPADVITLCEADGQIRPLRVRFQDHERAYCRIDIDRIISQDEIHHVGAETQLFLCRGTVFGETWVIELSYSMRSHRWFICRIG